MFHQAVVLSAVTAAFVPVIAVAVIVAAFVILAVCFLRMGTDDAQAPTCPDCGEPIEEGRDMALEDEWE